MLTISTHLFTYPTCCRSGYLEDNESAFSDARTADGVTANKYRLLLWCWTWRAVAHTKLLGLIQGDGVLLTEPSLYVCSSPVLVGRSEPRSASCCQAISRKWLLSTIG